MKNTIKYMPFVLLAVLISGLFAFDTVLAQQRGGNVGGSAGAASAGIPSRKIEQNAFGVGEELVYDVNFGFVTAGTARMAIPRLSTINGRSCYHVEFTVNSKPFFDAFYRVRDRYESHIDVEGLFPWRFLQRIREGNYKRDFTATFDHARLKAFTSEGEYPIEPFTQDVVSAFYFMRAYNFDGFRPGREVYLKNFYKDSTYVLTVRYLGKQTVKVSAGTFRCILLEPVMQEGGLFKASGRIVVWLTDDERRIPVQVDAEIPIGSITSELISYKGVRGPIRARVK